jgi:raffinose/stachyose/melibiose transport system substrate-binding protein
MHRILAKAALGAAIVSLATVSIAGCSSSSGSGSDGGGKVTLTYWNQITDSHTTKAENAIIADFEKSHPNITIKQTRYDSTNQLTPLSKNAFRSSSTPDLIYSEVSTGRDLFNAGLAVNLNDYAKKYDWKSRITPSGLAWTTTPKGDLYGLGLESELSGILWNKTLLQKYGLSVPTTVDELDHVCQVARANNIVPIATGAGGGGWIWYFYLGLPIVNKLGVAAEKDFVTHKSGKWTDPAIKQAVETVFKDAKNSNCFIPQMNSLEGSVAQDMLTNEKAMSLAPAFTGTLTPVYAANSKDDFDFTPWIGVPGGKGQYHLQGMGSAFVINKKSQHQDAAAEFINYMFTKPVATKYIETAGFLPPVQGIDVNTLKIDPLFKQGADDLINHGDDTGTTVDLVSSDSFNDLIGREGQEAFDGQITVDQYLQDLQAAWAKDTP